MPSLFAKMCKVARKRPCKSAREEESDSSGVRSACLCTRSPLGENAAVDTDRKILPLDYQAAVHGILPRIRYTH